MKTKVFFAMFVITLATVFTCCYAIECTEQTVFESRFGYNPETWSNGGFGNVMTQIELAFRVSEHGPDKCILCTSSPVIDAIQSRVLSDCGYQHSTDSYTKLDDPACSTDWEIAVNFRYAQRGQHGTYILLTPTDKRPVKWAGTPQGR